MSCRLALSLLFSFLLVRSLEARSIGDAASAVTVAGEIHNFAIDLNSSSFETVLKESPANFAIVEFFAHWCPACRNYKPHYEKVARLFNGPNAVHPGVILMTRVDCADKVNTDLCNKFSITYYPVLLWGPSIKFVAGRWDPKQENSEIRAIDDRRTAQRLLNWINKQIGSSFTLDDEKYENENILSRNASDPEQVIKSDTRAPLIKFFQLLGAHHPSKRFQTLHPVRYFR